MIFSNGAVSMDTYRSTDRIRIGQLVRDRGKLEDGSEQ